MIWWIYKISKNSSNLIFKNSEIGRIRIHKSGRLIDGIQEDKAEIKDLNSINNYGAENKIIKKEIGIPKHDIQTLQLKENKNKSNAKVKIGALNNSKLDLSNLMNTE